MALKLVLLPGCGHWIQQERSAEANAEMIDFLQHKHRRLEPGTLCGRTRSMPQFTGTRIHDQRHRHFLPRIYLPYDAAQISGC